MEKMRGWGGQGKDGRGMGAVWRRLLLLCEARYVGRLS